MSTLEGTTTNLRHHFQEWRFNGANLSKQTTKTQASLFLWRNITVPIKNTQDKYWHSSCSCLGLYVDYMLILDEYYGTGKDVLYPRFKSENESLKYNKPKYKWKIHFDHFWEEKKILGFPCHTTIKDLCVHVSIITTVGLLLTKQWWILFSGYG